MLLCFVLAQKPEQEAAFFFLIAPAAGTPFIFLLYHSAGNTTCFVTKWSPIDKIIVTAPVSFTLSLGNGGAAPVFFE